MMPVIRISDATWQRLKSHAVPLEDSAEDVVRKALDALDTLKGNRSGDSEAKPFVARSKRKRGRKLPQREFRKPLLEVLSELGGRATVGDVRRLMLERVSPLLGDADYESVSSGDPRWWNAVCWERNDLVKEGLFKSNSPRGIWELSGQALTRGEASPHEQNKVPEDGTWRTDIETALHRIDRGEGASLHEIYKTAEEIRKAKGRSVPPSLEATIRRTLEDNSSDSENFRGVDIFYMAEGKGGGRWGLRSLRKSPTS